MAVAAGAVCARIVVMSLLTRSLSADECAVIVKRRRVPLLLCGPGSVRTFWRWKQVVVVNRKPFAIDIAPEPVMAKGDVQMTVSARVEGQVIDPVAAALSVVDYEDATRAIALTAIRAVVKSHSGGVSASVSPELEEAFFDAVGEAVQAWGVSLVSATIHSVQS
jgi:hypothetical protein